MSVLTEILQKHEGQKTAIYGLGAETEKWLPKLKEKVKIVGLLDSYREEGELYGVPIIPIKQAVEIGVELIIVIARPGSCKAIAKRIGTLCREHQVALVDIYGKDLCEIHQTVYQFLGKKGVTKKELLEKIEKNQVISVDFFDTIFMRLVLFPTDVIELVEADLKQRGIEIHDFVHRRMNSERELSKRSAPNLVQIYTFMLQSQDEREGIEAEELAALEWEIEQKLLIPRQEICNLLAMAKEQGKNIYIISDSYYKKNQLLSLLQQWNLDFCTDIYSSCEFSTGKMQNLFPYVQARIGKESWLHIGDDIAADVESAQKHGLEVCQIYSGMELFEMTGYLGLWESIDGLVSRMKAGMFVAKLFNSPFQFEKKHAVICISSAEDLGYLLFAPIITDFVLWFSEQIDKNGIKNIWFSARDGYLIKKLYDQMRGINDSTYFLTSRTAAIRAGVESKEDIGYIENMRFSGSLWQQMQERFGIEIGKESEVNSKKSTLDYADLILAKAKIQRKNYQTYINKLELKEGEIAFFDFVAKGTCQMYCERLVNHHLHGFYFQKTGEKLKQEKLDIDAFYGEEEEGISENYDILETILASPEPSILEFNDKGSPVYASENRTQNVLQCLLRLQKGIEGYFQKFLEICPKGKYEVNKKQDELFFKMIYHLQINNLNFKEFQMEDAFFNRMTNITDLLS